MSFIKKMFVSTKEICWREDRWLFTFSIGVWILGDSMGAEMKLRVCSDFHHSSTPLPERQSGAELSNFMELKMRS